MGGRNQLDVLKGRAMTDFPNIELNDLPGLLAHINPDDRDTWVQVAMGVKAEFGEPAFSDWDSWSQGGAGYKPAAARSVWKSCKGGKVGIGTVIHLAKQGGWQPRKRDLTPAERERMRAEQAERRAKRAAEQAEEERLEAVMQEQVQVGTHRLLAEFTAARGKSDYLDRKQVSAFGVRFVTKPLLFSADSKHERSDIWLGADMARFLRELPKPKPDHIGFMKLGPGDLIIPLADEAGTVWSFQAINAQGTKLFPKFARKSGCFHWVGKADPMPIIALAEGYATAVSVYQATEWPTVMCVDVGNMAKVAAIIAQQYPESRLIIAGDDDPKADGTNPGRVAAEALGLELGITAVFPERPEVAA